jgi:hypothetical protein
MPSRTRVSVIVSFAIAVVAAGAVAGCGSSSGTGSPSASTQASSASASASTSTPAASPSAVAGCDVAPWRSAPVTVTHQVSVPPVPVVSAVRVAQHTQCGYDRVVLDITGPLPSYSIRYVNQVIADASGRTITMPGARYLLITLRPAQAHSNAGTPTVTVGVRQPGYPALASWALAGDVEGVVRIALGLAGPASIRTGELAGRIYIDLKE